jgi:hypothetical protein
VNVTDLVNVTDCFELYSQISVKLPKHVTIIAISAVVSVSCFPRNDNGLNGCGLENLVLGLNYLHM